MWVNMQRTDKKKLDRGEPSHVMTAARAAKLEALGFDWQALAARPPPQPPASVRFGIGAKRKWSAAVSTAESVGRRWRLDHSGAAGGYAVCSLLC